MESFIFWMEDKQIDKEIEDWQAWNVPVGNTKILPPPMPYNPPVNLVEVQDMTSSTHNGGGDNQDDQEDKSDKD